MPIRRKEFDETVVKRPSGPTITERLRPYRKVLAAGLVLIIVLVATKVILSRQRRWIESQTLELEKLQHDRRVTDADQLVDNLRRNESRKLRDPRLGSQVEKTAAWLTEEHQRLTSLQDLLAKLRQHAQASFADARAETIAQEWNAARQITAGIAPEFRASNEAALREFENQFDPILVATQPKRQAEFQELLGKCEPLVAALDRHDLALPALRDRSAQGLALLDQLESLANPPAEKLKLPGTLTGRLAPLKAKLDGLQADLATLDKAALAMHAANTFPEYLAGLRLYDGEQVRYLPAVHAAHAVVDAKPRESEFERLLLMPNDPAGWASFLQHPDAVALPKEVPPAEKAKWFSLRDDENLRDIHHYVMPDGPNGVPVCFPVNHVGAIYTRGAVQNFKINPMGETGNVMFAAMVYIPTPDSTQAEFKQAYCGCEYYHAEIWGVEKMGGLSPESACWMQSRSPDLTDVAGDHYSNSVLALLDGVRAGATISPLFKAYVQLRLLEILAIRPSAWNSHLIPALAQEEKGLRDLHAADLQSGDWMVPAKVEQFRDQLAAFYARTKDISYVKQERYLQTLLSAVHVDGLQFDGYAAADGSPVINAAGRSHARLWGWTDAGQTPTLLFQNVPGQANLQPLAKPMPFTPLFSCKRNPAELMEIAAKAAGIVGTNAVTRPPLPPLFQDGENR